MLGKIVVYHLRDVEVERAQKGKHNSVMEGDAVAMLITRDWGGGMVNGTAFLDGEITLWVTSVSPGDGPGQYRPVRFGVPSGYAPESAGPIG